MNRSTLLILTSLLIGSHVHGALNINVTGVIGSGQTNWEFDGSYGGGFGFFAGVEGYFSAADGRRAQSLNSFAHNAGQLSGEFLPVNSFDNAILLPTGGSATVTGVTTGIHFIDGIFLNDDGAVGGDDFAWFSDGAYLDQLEPLTLTGTIVFAVDISQFGDGATAITNEGDSFSVSSSSEITPFSMSFEAVPEPSAYAAVLGLVGLGVAVWRRS